MKPYFDSAAMEHTEIYTFSATALLEVCHNTYDAHPLKDSCPIAHFISRIHVLHRPNLC